MIELKSFLPFKDAAHALENANDVSEGDWLVLIPQKHPYPYIIHLHCFALRDVLIQLNLFLWFILDRYHE